MTINHNDRSRAQFDKTQPVSSSLTIESFQPRIDHLSRRSEPRQLDVERCLRVVRPVEVTDDLLAAIRLVRRVEVEDEGASHFDDGSFRRSDVAWRRESTSTGRGERSSSIGRDGAFSVDRKEFVFRGCVSRSTEPARRTSSRRRCGRFRCFVRDLERPFGRREMSTANRESQPDEVATQREQTDISVVILSFSASPPFHLVA